MGVRLRARLDSSGTRVLCGRLECSSEHQERRYDIARIAARGGLRELNLPGPMQSDEAGVLRLERQAQGKTRAGYDPTYRRSIKPTPTAPVRSKTARPYLHPDGALVIACPRCGKPNLVDPAELRFLTRTAYEALVAAAIEARSGKTRGPLRVE